MYNISPRIDIFLIFLLFLIHVKRIEDRNAPNKKGNVTLLLLLLLLLLYVIIIIIIIIIIITITKWSNLMGSQLP